MAVHAGSASGLTTSAVDRADRSEAERVRRRQQRWQSSAALHHHYRSDSASACRRTVGMGARALQPGTVAESLDRTGFAGHERGHTARAGDPQQQSRSRVLASDSVRGCWTSDTGYDAFIVPAFESGRLAGLGMIPRRLRLPRRRRGPPTPVSKSHRTFPTTIAGTFAPVTAATSATWSACSSRNQSTQR